MKIKKWNGITVVIALLALLVVPFSASAASEDDVRAMMNTMNDQLAARGENFRLGVVEIMGADEVGPTVYFNHRTLQLGSHWVPGDPNRGGQTYISWLYDPVDGTANGTTQAATEAAIVSAMATWQAVTCSYIPLVQFTTNDDWGYVQFWYWWDNYPGENGGWWYWPVDLTFAGYLPGEFFEYTTGPGSSAYVLGVTFTFIWIDTTTGQPTDMDNNGKADVAFREIYGNNNFTWATNGVNHYDVETVMLHEAGHGLSQGHFGMAFRTTNGKLHFAPRALMNAAYTGINRVVVETDNAGHCSIWASWPNN
jgi:hypothetical protein